MTENIIKTSISDSELQQAMTDLGPEKAYEEYQNKGGSAPIEHFLPSWKSLIERMLNGYTNNMGVSIAEEKYKRKNPFWDPRD